MRRLIGYLHTLHQYARTTKGRHDILDYVLACGTFLLVVAIVFVILSLVR